MRRHRIPAFARRRKPPMQQLLRLGERTDADAFQTEYGQAVGGGASEVELAEIRERHGVTVVAKSRATA